MSKQHIIRRFVQSTLWGCETKGKLDPKKARRMLAHLELQLSHINDYVIWGDPDDPETESAHEFGDMFFATYEALHSALAKHARETSQASVPPSAP